MFKSKTLNINHIRLFEKIILVIICLCIIGIYIFSEISSKNTKKNEMESIQHTLQQYSNECKNSIESLIESQFKALEYIASFPEIQGMNWNEQYEFLSRNKNKIDFEHFIIMDLEGNGHYVETNTIINQKNEQFFYDVIENERFVTQPFFQYYQNRSITTLSVSIYKDNKKVGALCGVINLEKIYNKIENIKIGDTGYGFIINSLGQYVSHKRMELVHNKFNVFDKLLKNNKYSDLIRNNFFNRKEMFMEIDLDNKTNFLCSKNIKDTDWTLIILVPKSEMLSKLYIYGNFQIGVVILDTILMYFSIKLVTRSSKSVKLAYTDPLVKINNRAGFNKMLEKLEKNEKDDITIIYFDLNDFKSLNDNFGHEEGDKFLCEFANMLKETFGKRGFVARLGGDEFTSIHLNISEREINNIIKELEKLINNYNENSKYNMSISIGYATKNKSQKEKLQCICRKADKNMYLYKNKYKNQNKSAE